MQIKNIVNICACALLFAGCAHDVGELKLKDANQFVADGKIALRYPKCNPRECKEESIGAVMMWRHQAHRDTVRFYDPMNREVLAITYQGDQVEVVEDGQKKTMSLADLEAEFGVALPIGEIAKWIFSKQNNGQEYTLNHAGWNIQLQSYKNGYYQKVTLKKSPYYARLILKEITDL